MGMKYVGLALCLLASPVWAAPFIVSDPVDATATHCGFKMDSAARVDVQVAMSGTSKICKMDAAGLAVGSHTVNATVIATDAVWGRRESPVSANFTFSVPAVPAAPVGWELQP